MTREEFILTRLYDERRMYRVLFFVCLVASLATVVMAVAMIVTGGIAEALSAIGVGAGVFASSLGFNASANSLSHVLQEVESDVEGLEFIEDYTVSTATAIQKLMLPAKTYFQQFIAYTACSVPMIAGGIVIVVFVWDEKALVALGLLLLLGGMLVGVLAFKSIRNWRAAKLLSSD